MITIKETLKQSPVFEHLEEVDIEKLGTLFDTRKIYEGDILATAKDTAHSFFLLSTGTVLLAMDEGKSVVLNTPGDFIGLDLLCAKGIYKTTLSVLEKGSVLIIPQKEYLDIIHEDSVLANTIMEYWQKYLEITAPFANDLKIRGENLCTD